MAKPRIFLSSTCYDLNDARASLTTFFEDFGFEVLNSQLTNFGVSPKVHSARACLDQVELADYLVLIIASRQGEDFPASNHSITNAEFNRAKELGIVINTFVKSEVLSARRIFKENPSANFASVVDDPRIFKFIDSISSSETDNWLHSFNSVSDIQDTMKSQFGHYLSLYAKHLGRVGNSTFRPVTVRMCVNGQAADCQFLGTDPLP